jgi:hypothetical protein
VFIVVISSIVGFLLLLVVLLISFNDIIDALFYQTYTARLIPAVVTLFSFLSQSFFNVLIIMQNKTVAQANRDANQRADAFRDQQFVSDNYSIIEFMDRMLMTEERKLYVEKYIGARRGDFHMILNTFNSNELFGGEDKFSFITIRIPFKVVEGKRISKITISKISFHRNQNRYLFRSIKGAATSGFLIFNGISNRQNLVMNLVVPSSSDFFNFGEVSPFSRIKLELTITSVLGVSLPGSVELYFENPDQVGADSSNSYKITSSIFLLNGSPTIEKAA